MHECALRQANSKAESTPLSWGFGDKTLTRIPAVFFPKMKAKMKFPGDVFPPRLHGPIKLLRYFPANEAAKICKECCICAVLDN